MIQEDDIIGTGSAAVHRLFSAEAGVYLDSVAAQHPFGDHKVHLLVVHSQNPDPLAGKWLAARGLSLLESVGVGLAVEQVYHGEGKERLVDDQKPA